MIVPVLEAGRVSSPMIYNLELLTSEQIAAIDTSEVLDGYPSFADRLRMEPHELSAKGRLVIPDDGPWYVDAHPNHLRTPAHLRSVEPDEAAIAYWQRLGLELDQKGRPIHPYGRQLLATVGVVTGPGFYWKLGPNATTNLIVNRTRASGDLEYTVVKKNDRRQKWMLPGGFVEIGETRVDAAVREFEEELGLSVRGLGSAAMVGGVIISPGTNTRDTLHAWGEDSAVALKVADESYLFDVALQPDPDEILDATWLTLDEMRQRAREGNFSRKHIRFVELSRNTVDPR